MERTAQHGVTGTGAAAPPSLPETRAAGARSPLAEELSTIAVLVRRDLSRFLRERAASRGRCCSRSCSG